MIQDVFNNSVVNQARGLHVRPAFNLKLEFFDALSTGDIETAANTFAADGQLLFPGLRPVQGRPLVKRMLGIIRRRYNDIAWQPNRTIIQSEGWIVTSWTVQGTFRDSALLYQNEGVSVIELDGQGRIAMLSDYFKDTLAFQPPARAPVHEAHRAHI